MLFPVDGGGGGWSQVHDNSERERKRGEGRNNAGESPNRPKIIDEPSLDIKIPGNERFAVETAGISTGGPATVRISSGGGGDDQDGDTVGSRNGGIGPVKSEEDSWGDAEAWRLATEEVRIENSTIYFYVAADHT